MKSSARSVGGRRINRREFMGLAAAGAGLLMLGGCGGSRDKSPSVLWAFNPAGAAIWSKQVERFNKEQGQDFQVQTRELPADASQQYDQLGTEFGSGSSNIDLVAGDLIWVAPMAARGYIANLSDRLTDDFTSDFLEVTVKSNYYDGNIYGVPWWHDAGMLYYRSDLLEQAGFSEPPRTWNEMKDQAQKIQRDAGTKYGYVFQGANYEGGVCNGLEFIWSAGGDVLDPEDPSKVIVDSPEAAEGLAVERSMVTDNISPEAIGSYKEDESGAAFLRGDAVFLRNWAYIYALASDPEESKVRPEQIGISVMPSVSGEGTGFGCLGDQPLFISADSSDQDLAWEFIKFLSSPEEQEFQATGGGFLPSLESLYSDDEVKKKVPVMTAGEEALKTAKSRPSSPYYSDMSLSMAERFNDALRGAMPPDEAVAALQKDLESIIERADG